MLERNNNDDDCRAISQAEGVIVGSIGGETVIRPRLPPDVALEYNPRQFMAKFTQMFVKVAPTDGKPLGF